MKFREITTETVLTGIRITQLQRGLSSGNELIEVILQLQAAVNQPTDGTQGQNQQGP